MKRKHGWRQWLTEHVFSRKGYVVYRLSSGYPREWVYSWEEYHTRIDNGIPLDYVPLTTAYEEDAAAFILEHSMRQQAGIQLQADENGMAALQRALQRG